MAIKLKKFSSTKSAWDALENCINENCSGPINELIAAGESQDKIKDTINYFIDHIMEGDSENKEFSSINYIGHYDHHYPNGDVKEQIMILKPKADENPDECFERKLDAKERSDRNAGRFGHYYTAIRITYA